MKLIQRVQQFIRKKWDGASPLLLGYSGGPDSKALLYALLDAGVPSLHLAHIDHGWREESAEEADLLECEADSLGIPFHLHRLTELPKGNLEDAGRVARLQFFRRLMDQIPFQALFLGHHGDDLAETTLKRTFEGARLCGLGGMAKESLLENMVVWRPLLEVPKAELERFLQERGLIPLYDRTNQDPKFLRTRLRQDVVPLLEASFGKNISANLRWLSERSQELKLYLDEQIASLQWVEGPWGAGVDLKGVPRIVQRHFLQEKVEGFLSREAIEAALDILQKGGRMELTKEIVIEQGSLRWKALICKE